MKKKLLWVIFVLAAVVCGALTFASCSNRYTGGSPEHIAYDGQYITWDRVDTAVYYTVSINGGDAVRSNSTTYAYTSDDSFEVTVSAVFKRGENATSQTFKPLAKIEELFVADDGTVSWEAVAGANAYTVSVNGQESTVADTVYTPVAGSVRIKVKPVVSGDATYYSQYSVEKSFSVYSAPSSLRYDAGYLTWSGGAPHYLVTVNGVNDIVAGTTYKYTSDNTDFSVSITALGNHTSTYDSQSVTEKFYYLDPITSLQVEDGVVKWNAVERAEKYKIEVDGTVQTAMTVDCFYGKIAPGKSHIVRIMPVNDSGKYYSSWSPELPIYLLPAPNAQWNSDLELDGDANNNFYWDIVAAADGYKVRISRDGKVIIEQSVGKDTPYFGYDYPEVGDYTIEVQATSVNADYYASKYSTPIVVERLAAPKWVTSNAVVSDADNLQRGVTFNFMPVAGASGYQLYKDGVALEGKRTTQTSITDTGIVEAGNIAEQHFSYKIRSLGGIKTNAATGIRTVTLPSLTSQSTSVDIIVQATPQHLLMSGFVLGWDAVSGNNGYYVAYDGMTQFAQYNSYNLSTLSAGDHQVTVMARGNGSNTLASNVSAPVVIKRIEAPTGIRITAEENGTLHHDEVLHATGYEVYLGNEQQALDTNAYNNMYQFIGEAGTTLHMRATANKYSDDGTVYYMESLDSPSQQFIRLSAPTFPEGAINNSAEIVWNAPQNINTVEYTPTYRLYVDIGEQLGSGNINGTKYPIADLEGGKNYTFYVKAIGNDTKYLDSDYSPVFSCYKIATPQIRVENGKYVWDSLRGAQSYYLAIDGQKVADNFENPGDTYSYTPNFTQVGNHTVELYALGDKRTVLDSQTYSFVQQTKLIATPTISCSYSGERFTDGGSITVTVTNAQICANNNGFEYVVGTTATSKESSYTKAVSNAGIYNIKVRALGGVIDENGIYYIASQYSAEQTLKILGSPSASTFSIDSYGFISWAAISGANGYDVEVTLVGKDGAVTTESVKVNGNSYMLSAGANYKNYSRIIIRVSARGDAKNNIVGSGWSEWTWTNNN